MPSTKVALIGTRLALVGTILYFLEWVAIPLAPSLPTDRLGDNPAEIFAAYLDRPGMTAFLAGWLALVLPGRILFTVALRKSLPATPALRPLSDLAVGVMTVSVAVEVILYALVAGAAWAAQTGGTTGAVVALDSSASMLNEIVFATVGLSMTAASVAMVRAGLFAPWLRWLGVVAGGLATIGGVVGGAALGADGSGHDIGALLTGVPLLGFWVWMIVTSVVLFRLAPGRGDLAA